MRKGLSHYTACCIDTVRKHMFVLGCTLVLLCPAAKASPPPGHLVLLGGFHLTDGELDLRAPIDPKRSMASGAYAGIRGGYMLVFPFALEASIGIVPTRDTLTNSTAVLMPLHFDATFYLTRTTVQPFLSVGVGIYQLLSNDLGKDVDLLITGAAGLRVTIREVVALRAEARLFASDALNKTMSTNFVFLGGLDILLGGIPSRTVPKNDLDGDGVKTPDDQCPTVPGPALLAGCPDGDGDGIRNSEDACPETAGIRRFRGCPDTDNDGIPDTQDQCPTHSGLTQLRGCPDGDGDGIQDGKDACPKQHGIKARHGCPKPMQTALKEINGVLVGVAFKNRKARLLPTSYAALTRLAAILKKHRHIRVEIRGHTRAYKNASKTMQLSIDRAQVVKNHLVEIGIDPDRLTPVGRGATQPPEAGQTADRIEISVVEAPPKRSRPGR
jgi:outer membrane protein OmpA-like peptidoglycan-associated protein